MLLINRHKCSAFASVVIPFSAAGILVLAVSVPAASAQNLVQDPGFESATVGILTGSLGDNAWTVTEGEVEVFSNPLQTNSGNQALQTTLSRSDYGAVTQNLTTVLGQSYLLSYYAASNTPQNPFTVLFGGQTVTSTPIPVTFPSGGNARGNYVQQSFFVTATSATTSLTFRGLFGSGGGYGTFIDDVSVTANGPAPMANAPEPGSVALLLPILGAASLIHQKRRKPQFPN